MAIVSFGGSAFVKLVVEEDGSDLAAALWDGCDAAVFSRLAYPEVRAALTAAERAHRLDPPIRVVLRRHGRATGRRPVWSSSPSLSALTPGNWPASTRSAADAVHLSSLLAVGGSDTLIAA